MPKIFTTRATIDQLTREVMPALRSFVAGRRPQKEGMVDLNEKVALLRDAIEGYEGPDKKAIQSIQVHGRNLGGALLSGLEKIGVRGVSTTLSEVIKRYDETVLEKAKTDYTELAKKYAVTEVPTLDDPRNVKLTGKQEDLLHQVEGEVVREARHDVREVYERSAMGREDIKSRNTGSEQVNMEQGEDLAQVARSAESLAIRQSAVKAHEDFLIGAKGVKSAYHDVEKSAKNLAIEIRDVIVRDKLSGSRKARVIKVQDDALGIPTMRKSDGEQTNKMQDDSLVKANDAPSSPVAVTAVDSHAFTASKLKDTLTAAETRTVKYNNTSRTKLTVPSAAVRSK